MSAPLPASPVIAWHARSTDRGLRAAVHVEAQRRGARAVCVAACRRTRMGQRTWDALSRPTGEGVPELEVDGLVLARSAHSQELAVAGIVAPFPDRRGRRVAGEHRRLDDARVRVSATREELGELLGRFRLASLRLLRLWTAKEAVLRRWSACATLGAEPAVVLARVPVGTAARA